VDNVTVQRERFGDGIDNSLGHGLGLGRVLAPHGNNKFVTAVSRHTARASGGRGQPTGYLDE